SGGESVSPVPSMAIGAKAPLSPGVSAWTRPENGTCWPRAGSPWLLFSDRHCCSPPSGNQSGATRRTQALAWAPSVAGRSSARQEAALLGPIERQIESGKARRSELDRLPAVQDRLDQRGVTSRAVVLYCHSRQHQPHFATAAPEGHRRCKLASAVARILR